MSERLRSVPPARLAPIAIPSSRRIQSLLTAFAVLLVMGLSLLTVVLVTRIFSRVNPSLLEDLRWNARRGALELAQTAEVGMVLRDEKMLREALGDYRRRSDVLAVVVRDKEGRALLRHGTPPAPDADLFAGPADQVRDGPGYLVSWHPAVIEGAAVGSLALCISTARLAEGEALRRSILGLAALGSVLALVLSLLFVQHNVTPLIRVTGKALEDLKAANEAMELRSAALSDANARLQDSLDLLHTTQEKLVNASRLSGMADVATTVLHNVGNVLNSVNVSANLVIETVRGSRLSGLRRVNELVAQHKDDLGGFFLRDPRAARLPAYLEQLAAAVTDEHATIDAELRSLQKNIDHIKVVIGMQQRHARTSGGALETGPVSEILDDALKLAAASDIRSPIRVDRQFHDLPEVTVDRHKLLQILMNLLSNARHAVRQAPPERQRIVVRLGPAPGERFSVEVEDSGYGIAPENLARIFSHGFTTKRDGHGFGLHSSANAAREMGGGLTAASGGVDRGARFRLVLPVSAALIGEDDSSGEPEGAPDAGEGDDEVTAAAR